MIFLTYLKYIILNNIYLFSITLLILLFTSLVEAGSILIIAPIIDILINSQTESEISKFLENVFIRIGLEFSLIYLFIIYFSITLFKSIFDVYSKRLLVLIKYEVIKKIVLETYTHIFDAGWHFFASEKHGKLINSFTREMDGIGDSLAFTGRLFSDLLKISIFIVIPFYISWEVSLISFGYAFLICIPMFFLGKFTRKLGKKETNTANDYLSVLQENFSLAKIIIGFGLEKKSKENVSNTFSNHRNAAVSSLTFNSFVSNIYLPISLIGIMLVFYTGKYYSLTLSEIGILFASYYKIIPIIGNIINSKSSIDASFPSYDQVKKIQEQANSFEKIGGDIKFDQFKDIISFENISFSYEKDKDFIKNLSFQIKKGQFIALVGESGSGKSTIIDLILGLNLPLKGQIKIDGVSIKDYDIKSYRQKIGYVPQNAALFNDTIINNIKWAEKEASDEKIKKILKDSYANEFIENFPKKYDTIVGERGTKLSGGQLQRIAFARALVKDPEILILDEATSSLDTNSEIEIQKTLAKIHGSKTVIAIAHRLSTIIKSDKIIVINSGKILEQGNYKELIEKNGSFKKMLDDQKFIEIE
tara:strand:+ start:343 stop:2109 length:1767 start_codon:yes stop_codon:yes gene_type:complete